MSFNVKGEKHEVNIAPVDSVGGAKPEAEERPLESKFLVENLAVRNPLGGSAPLNVKEKIFVQSEAIATAQHTFGTSCGTCKHFNFEAGRAFMNDINRLAASGDMQARIFERNFKCFVIGDNPALAASSDVYAHPSAPDPVDLYIGEMGICHRYSEILNDAHFCHPTEGCPSESDRTGMATHLAIAAKTLQLGPDGQPVLPEPLPLFYEAKSSEIDKLVKGLRDNLLFTADAAKKG